MCKRYVFTLVLCCVFAALTAPDYASADVGWEIASHAMPSSLAPGGKGLVLLRLFETGTTRSHGQVTVTDELPPGVTFQGVPAHGYSYEEEHWNCSGTTFVTCTNTEELTNREARVEAVELGLEVKVDPQAREGQYENHVSVLGGGSLTTATSSTEVNVSSTTPEFGFEDVNAWTSANQSSAGTQAGSHPGGFTLEWNLKTVFEEPSVEKEVEAAGQEVRNLSVNLPPGFIGDPQAVPRCTRQQFDDTGCPADTQIGQDTAYLGGYGRVPFAVYNLIPPPGMPAQFAFSLLGVQTFLDASVRSDGNYGITEHVRNIVQRGIVSNITTIWGAPSESRHDSDRKGVGCEYGGCSSYADVVPFLTLPTSCEGPQPFSIEGEAWGSSGVTSEATTFLRNAAGSEVGFTGCDHLGFEPSLTVAPDTTEADTPAGLTADVKVAQEGLTSLEGFSTSNIKNTSVTLPEGVVVNPGQAAGLAACQSWQDGIGTEEAPSCPSASKVGTDEIETPLLAKPLQGSVYVLQSNPPNLKLLVAASGEGVNLKLVGDVHLDESTGRLTTTFTETPELPFTDFKLSFSGGAQAALATPLRCGTYTTTSDFTPWSSPFVQDAFSSNSFGIDHGSGGAACPSSTLPFTPSMIAGSTTDQAAGYTNFSLLLQRPADQQRMSGLQFKTPEGLLGMISKVPLCPEPEASQGTCSAPSQIGHTVVEAGPGPYPLVVPQPGQPPAPIYLTGGYKGAPYGLSIVVPLVVGPFTLQTQVVRAKIEVDPHTARLTVTTDPLPTIIDGIPADLRTINAVIDRPGFMFNPTNCSPQSFTGIATSTEGATAPLESHFQMGSCQSLSFKPNFKVATSGKTSRKNGASLNVKLRYPSTPPGNNQASSQSNIQSVKVDLPKQLPSRLTTLQKACPVATFEANPAACPSASIVGSATAITPVLPVPVTGPAYFVSHAGEEFPQLIIVLQGYGVTIDLVGDTFINSKTNVTSSTFKRIPDVPITSFELTLPQGPFSALAANANLCKSTLKMPTAFTAQDGAVIHQSTPISVTGCAKQKAKSKKHSTKHKRKK
ncbi:MAG: hypothetical protein WBV85_11500 [Solirubrobacteraceae bacterium]